MFFANYKATLKTLLRSPAVILAVVAAIIMICTYSYWQHGIGFVADSVVLVRQDIYNMARCSTWNLFPAFMGVLVASNILVEKNNHFSDLLLSSGGSFPRFYISKILALWTVGVLVHFVFLGAWSFHYWAIQERSVTIAWWDALRHYVIMEAIYLPLSLLVSTSIAVFCGVATGVPAMSAVGIMVYSLLDSIFVNLKLYYYFAARYLYYIPKQLDLYLMSFHDWGDAEYEELICEYLSVSAPTAVLAAAFHVIVSLLLFIISYIILKKRYKK